MTLGDGSLLAQKLTALAALLHPGQPVGSTGIDLTVPDRPAVPAVLTARQTAGTVSTLAVG